MTSLVLIGNSSLPLDENFRRIGFKVTLVWGKLGVKDKSNAYDSQSVIDRNAKVRTAEK